MPETPNRKKRNANALPTCKRMASQWPQSPAANMHSLTQAPSGPHAGPAPTHSPAGKHPAPSGTFWTGKHCRKRPPAETGTPGKKQILRETMTAGKIRLYPDRHERQATLAKRPRQPDARHCPPFHGHDTRHTPSSGGFFRSFHILPVPSFPGGSGQPCRPAFSGPATSPDTGFSAPTLLRYYLPEKIHKKTGQTWKNRHAGRFFPPGRPSHGRSRHWTMKTTS